MSSGMPIKWPCGCMGHFSREGMMLDERCVKHSRQHEDILALQLNISVLQKNFPNGLIDVSGGEGGVFVNLTDLRGMIDRIREGFEKEHTGERRRTDHGKAAD